MVRLALPAAAALIVLAGCGSRAEPEAAAPAAARASTAAAAAPAPAAAPKPAAEKPRKRKKGEVEAAPIVVNQPPARDLPADAGLDTTPEMLSVQALLAAREDVAAGQAGDADQAQRHAFILAAWRPAHEERRGVLEAVRAAREARVQRELVTAKRVAEHEARVDALDATYAPQIRAEQARTAPILER
jgi:hypothetical protein